jgi:hypothetical protein
LITPWHLSHWELMLSLRSGFEASVLFLQDFDSNANTPCKRSDNSIQPSNYRSILRQVPS